MGCDRDIMNEPLKLQLSSHYYLYILIALFPILSLYELMPPLISLGYGVLLCIVAITIIKNRLSSKINFSLLITMSSLIIINLIVGVAWYTNIANTINNTAAMMVFSFLAIFMCTISYLDKEALYKACKLVGTFATIFLFYQFIAYYLFDQVIYGSLPFLASNSEIGFRSIEWGRPTSFFYEPAHYVIYIAPVYVMSMIKKEYRFSLLFMLGLLLSTSSTGLIMALFMPVFIFMTGTRTALLRNISLVVLGLIVLIFLSDNFYDMLFTKITPEGLMKDIRVFGSLEYFKYLRDQEWLFGVGFNRLSEFVMHHSYSVVKNYANAYFFAFLSFGVVGGLIWVGYNFSLYFGIAPGYKSMLVLLVLISMSDQILFGKNLLYLLIWVYAVSSPTLEFNENDRSHTFCRIEKV